MQSRKDSVQSPFITIDENTKLLDVLAEEIELGTVLKRASGTGLREINGLVYRGPPLKGTSRKQQQQT